MLHTFLRYCSYTEQWRRPLRLQAHSPSVDQGHSIAMERQACPSISSAMVHCKGTKHCPYFTDWNDTFIFFFTPSPQSPFYFFLSYRCTISSHQRCISIDIYVSAYIYIQREREKSQTQKAGSWGRCGEGCFPFAFFAIWCLQEAGKLSCSLNTFWVTWTLQPAWACA